MNIEHKKTALDDDSVLYQKRDDSLGKKDTSTLTKQQKLGYFKDYYLRAILIALAVLALAGSLIYNMFFRHQVDIISVAVLGDAWMTEADTLMNDLRSFYELTDKDQLIEVANYNLDEYGDQMKFTTLIAAKSIDVIICSQDQFEKYSKFGYFNDLSKTLPADVYAQYEDKLLLASMEDTDNEGNVTKTYPAAPYGIDITQYDFYKMYGGTCSKPILGFVSSSERIENAIRFLDFVNNPVSAEAAQEESPQT